MAQQDVTIKITTDASQAVRSIKGLQTALSKLSSQSGTSTKSIDGINHVITESGILLPVASDAAREYALALKDVDKASEKNGKRVRDNTGEVRQFVDASGAASFALLSIGQAFQDSAQFGMGLAQGLRAVNNNIQQVFTSIALGSAQAGGMKNFFGEMSKQLIGPGGAIIAFSIVTAGIEFFTTRAQRAAKDTDELAKKFKEAADSVFTFQDSLSGMTVNIPESAITPLRAELEKQIGIIDDLIAKSEESSQDLFRIASIARSPELLQKAVNAENEIVAAKEEIATLDMDRIEGQRRLLALLKQQEGFLEKRDELLQIAKDLGLDIESTAKTTLTEIEKLTEQYEDLVRAFGGDGQAERQQGALNARIQLLQDLQDATVNYSQSIEEMRLLMNQEGQEVISETERLEDLNEELRERIRLRRQIMGLEKIGADQLRGLGEATQDFTEEYKRESDERIKADAESAEAFFAMQQGISKGIGLVSQSFGSMGTTFMQLAQQQEGGSRRMFKIGKALAISQAVMNSYVAYTTALADKTIPGPMRFVAAGAALAAGLAQVAAIKSAEFGQGGKGRQVSAPNVFAGVTSVGALPGGAASQLALQPASQRSDLSVAALGGFGGGVQVELVAQGRNLVSVSSMEANASKRRSGLQTIGGGIIR